MDDSKDEVAPVFITGYPRSGTTLLFRYLALSGAFGHGNDDDHSPDQAIETAIGFLCNPLLDFEAILRSPWPQWAVAIPSATHRAGFAARASAQGGIRRAWEALIGRWAFNDRHFEPARTDLDDLHQRQPLPGARRPRRRALALGLSLRRANIRHFVRLLAQSQGTNRPREKYPFHYLVMPELLAALPQAKFLFISRHPVDVYRSLLRRAHVSLQKPLPVGATSWMLMASPAFARDWNLAAECCARFQDRHSGRLLHVRYEDLTQDTARTAAAIGEFLGIEMPPLPARLGPEATHRHANFFLQSAAPVWNDTAHLPRLHEYDEAVIREVCGSAARQLGY